jgi:hypothetical protein
MGKVLCGKKQMKPRDDAADHFGRFVIPNLMDHQVRQVVQAQLRQADYLYGEKEKIVEPLGKERMTFHSNDSLWERLIYGGPPLAAR